MTIKWQKKTAACSAVEAQSGLKKRTPTPFYSIRRVNAVFQRGQPEANQKFIMERSLFSPLMASGNLFNSDPAGIQ
jgi:hypothetical protein